MDALIARALARVDVEFPALDGVSLSVQVGVSPEADLPDDDHEATGLILRQLAEVFSQAAGDAASPALAFR